MEEGELFFPRGGTMRGKRRGIKDQMVYVMLEWTLLERREIWSGPFFFVWACKDDVGRRGSGPRLSGPMRGLGFDQEMGKSGQKSG